MVERKKIPRQVKDYVRRRQNWRCAACIEIGRNFHHVRPIYLDGEDTVENIVLLCEEHHRLLHLGDLETCLTILEYIYYLKNWELPDDVEKLRELSANIMQEEDLIEED